MRDHSYAYLQTLNLKRFFQFLQKTEIFSISDNQNRIRECELAEFPFPFPISFATLALQRTRDQTSCIQLQVKEYLLWLDKRELEQVTCFSFQVTGHPPAW